MQETSAGSDGDGECSLELRGGRVKGKQREPPSEPKRKEDGCM